MTTVIVVGDGPAGLSCALFLAKNGVETTVFGLDKTSMHYALLYNYLGIPKMLGDDFQEIALKQVEHFGARLQRVQVTAIQAAGDGVEVTTADGATHKAKYVVLAEGKALKLTRAIGLEESGSGVAVDRNGRTSMANVYAAGRVTRRTRSQAIISAGEGAVVALDILSAEHGREYNDFDEPPKQVSSNQ